MSFPSNPKILMVGAGAMGSAMLSGWVASDEGAARDLSAFNFTVVEHSEEKAACLHDEYGVSALTNLDDTKGDDFDIVVLAVKPQVMDGVLENLGASGMFDVDQAIDQETGSKSGRTPLVVTIAAGIPTAHFEEMLGDEVRVVRVMPNMPLQVGCGATAVAAGKNAEDADVEYVQKLFSCIGEAYLVDESQIDAVCALSGGGPAYVAYLIEALRDAGVAQGLDGQLAEQLAKQTFSGTCALMNERSMSPEEVRRAVCSPGGTTLAALSAMDQAGFADSVTSGISAAVNRARELAS